MTCGRGAACSTPRTHQLIKVTSTAIGNRRVFYIPPPPPQLQYMPTLSHLDLRWRWRLRWLKASALTFTSTLHEQCHPDPVTPVRVNCPRKQGDSIGAAAVCVAPRLHRLLCRARRFFLWTRIPHTCGRGGSWLLRWLVGQLHIVDVTVCYVCMAASLHCLLCRVSCFYLWDKRRQEDEQWVVDQRLPPPRPAS